MVKLKTLEDIKKIKKANEIIARLYEDIIPKYIKPGISTWEIDAICEDYIKSQGAIPGTKGYDIGWPYPPYPASTCISINEKVVHGIPSKTEILKEGDILSLDTVTILNGYFGDAAKTFAVGNIDDKSRKLIEVTEKAREIGIEQARVGNRIGDIGFAMHEDPYVLNYGKANTGLKIENGLVIAIEPMVNIGTFKVKILKDMWTVVTQDKKRSAHFEHSVAIVDGKPLILSQK
ncbi:type I methionyl aminopeptidase [Streptobacillus moniliformis]|uniref:type I methionyl aminopeptidase n=1 Tax=Streptobacillus moniliformis TaxID=34105 RepID=UPI0007E40A0E|nr:M24 family metallopeptidase [Streptobacillus moniliformis]